MGWSSAYAVTLAERITLNYLSYFDFWGILIRNDNHSTDTTIKNAHSNSTSNTNLDWIPLNNGATKFHIEISNTRGSSTQVFYFPNTFIPPTQVPAEKKTSPRSSAAQYPAIFCFSPQFPPWSPFFSFIASGGSGFSNVKIPMLRSGKAKFPFGKLRWNLQNASLENERPLRTIDFWG